MHLVIHFCAIPRYSSPASHIASHIPRQWHPSVWEGAPGNRSPLVLVIVLGPWGWGSPVTAWGQSRGRSHFSDGIIGVPPPALVPWCSSLCGEMGLFWAGGSSSSQGRELFRFPYLLLSLCLSLHVCRYRSHHLGSSLAISLLNTDFSDMPERQH